jgi:hypothetical protein
VLSQRNVFGAWQTQGYTPNLQGSLSALAATTIYQAATDGIVTVSSTGYTGTEYLTGYTDSSSTPTTARVSQQYVTGGACTICFPVKKNDYYQVTRSATGGTFSMYFLPLGS